VVGFRALAEDESGVTINCADSIPMNDADFVIDAKSSRRAQDVTDALRHGSAKDEPKVSDYKVCPCTDISLSSEIVRLAIFRDNERNPPSCAVSASCDFPES
jgi:hypothetical protein